MAAHNTSGARAELAMHWPILVLAALAVGFGTMGIGFYSLGLFVKPLQAEFGWSRGAVSGAATFQQLGIFLSAPLVGRLSDRIGVKAIALTSFVAMPLAMLALSHTGGSVPQWYGLWLLVSLAGCGTTPAVWARVVLQRFDAARGLALGLMLVGTGLAAALAPALLGRIFAEHGWRYGAMVMAAASAVVGIPLCLVLPKGKRSVESGTKAKGRFEGNRAIWLLLVVGILLGVIVAGLIIHLVPMLVDRGMQPAAAANVAASVGLAVIASRVVVGWMFDRFHAPYVAAVFLAMPIGSCLLLGLGGPVVPAAVMLGLAAGAEVDMLAFFTSRYAAMKNYGATYGIILGAFCLGAAFGPLAVGQTVDASGNYNLALILSAVGLVAVVGMVLALGPYRQAVAED